MTVSLPHPIQASLDELLAALERVFGDELKAVVLHGSAARGDYLPEESDVDLVVVLREASLEALEQAGAALQFARYAARIEAILMLEAEAAGAADVFPLMYQDIKEEGVALRGDNPFVALSPKREHVRLRVEQELREAQMRLRRSIAEARGDEVLLRKLVTRKARQLRSPLRAALRLLGAEAPVDLAALHGAVAARHSLPTAGLPEAADPRAAAGALNRLLTELLHEVDGLEVT